jgi:hypothetical protein
MKRSGPAPDGYVTRILARHTRDSEATRGDLARALGCDPSRISHQISGRQAIPADELEVWCDVLGTHEPLEAIADRLGLVVRPKERRVGHATLERGGYELLAHVGHAGAELGQALADGHIDDAERTRIRRALRAARDVLDDLIARVPEVAS